MSRQREEAIGIAVAEHLRSQGWDVYCEVEAPGGRCDVVAVRPESGVVLAVECKVDLCWRLLMQAMHWEESANYVAVATAAYLRGPHHALAEKLLSRSGFGWFTMRSDGLLTEAVKATPLRTEQGELRTYCREEQKNWAAPGNNKGERYTPFAATAKLVEEYVRLHPRCSAEEILANVDHHWREPKVGRPILVRMARQKKLGPVTVKFYGTQYLFYIDEADPSVALDAGLADEVMAAMAEKPSP